MAKKKEMNPKGIIKESAEHKFKDELQALHRDDKGIKPEGWNLSPKAVLTYLTGGKLENGTIIQPKYIGDQKILELCIATLLTDRGLLLMGIPGTAKSWLSEHLAAAISGVSTLMIQGTMGVDETTLKYSWNYAALLQNGPDEQALVKGPVLRAMEDGKICRIEELTRMPTEVQDILISVLSEKIMIVPELKTEYFGVRGFNIIATANDRDRGVHDLSAALRRRFNIVYMPIPATLEEEVAIIKFRLEQMQADMNLQQYVIPSEPLVDLVRIFRELRSGSTEDKTTKLKSPSSSLSTAEALSVLMTGMQNAIYFGDGKLGPANLIPALYSTVVKDSQTDINAWNEYVQTVMRKRKEWKAWYDAALTLSGQ